MRHAPPRVRVMESRSDRLLRFVLSCYDPKVRATLAQLVERLIRNQQVAGSIPAGGSNQFNPFDSLISHGNLQG